MTRLALAIALGTCVVARVAAADPQADAERFYNDGQAAYDDKRFDDAIAAWHKAYDLSKLAALQFNLAQAQRLGGHCTAAVDAYKAFIKADPTSPQRPDAESRLREIEPCPAAPAVVQVVSPPPPPITKPIEPGSHGHAGAYVVGGLGVALAIGGGVFGAQAASAASDVKAACASGCAWTPALADQESTGKRDQTLQYALYGAGAVAIVTAVLLYRRGSHEHAASVAIVPHLDGARADGATVSWSGAW